VAKNPFTRKKLIEDIDSYFSDEESVKSFAGLALHLGVDSDGLSELFADKRFGDVLARAGTHIEKDIVENGLRGRYNATMSSFLLKTVFGYSEKPEQAADVKVEMADELKKYAV
jgi:hypothetical protein